MKQRALHATAVAAAVACLLSGMATELLAQPAAVALPKVGSCPSGYSTSGDYCLANQGARHAMPKTGSCPSGYSTSGDYCLSSR